MPNIFSQFTGFTATKLSKEKCEQYKTQIEKTLAILQEFGPRVVINLSKKEREDLTPEINRLKLLCAEHKDILHIIEKGGPNAKNYIREFDAFFLHILSVELYAICIKSLLQQNSNSRSIKTILYQDSKKLHAEGLKAFDAEHKYNAARVKSYLNSAQTLLDNVREMHTDNEDLNTEHGTSRHASTEEKEELETKPRKPSKEERTTSRKANYKKVTIDPKAKAFQSSSPAHYGKGKKPTKKPS